METEGIRYRKNKESRGVFHIQAKNEDQEDKFMALIGGKIAGYPIQNTRVRIKIEAQDIFKLVGDHLRAHDNAEAMRMSLGGTTRVAAIEETPTTCMSTPNQSSQRGNSRTPNKVVREYQPAPRAPTPVGNIRNHQGISNHHL